MSGVLIFAALAPQPLLLTHSFNDTTPGQAGFGVRFWRAGHATVTNGGGTVQNLLPEWAGAGVPATIGDQYQVRLTVVSSSVWDVEFDVPDVWITLNDTVNPSAHYVTSGTSGNAVAKFEIRRLSTQQIVASANWTFTWAS